MRYLGSWNGRILILDQKEKLKSKDISKIIEGQMELFPLDPLIEHAIICVINGEGKNENLPINAYVIGNDGRAIDYICGNIVFLTVEGSDFALLSEEQAEVLEEYISDCPRHEGTLLFVP